MTGRVHNHAPYRPICNERDVDGQLRGACLNDDGTAREQSADRGARVGGLRGWWGRRRSEVPETHKTAPVGDLRAPSDRLTAPTGRVVFVCATPTGRVGCVHDTEAQAKWHGNTDGRVWWPVVIDEDETGEMSA